VGLTTRPCKKKIVEKPPRNSAGFCGGGQGLSWAVEPRKEEVIVKGCKCMLNLHIFFHYDLVFESITNSIEQSYS
jgi:hypothetical protein